MDMVIFRTIFFELFSFLHVHTPYLPFHLLMNLGAHQKTRQNAVIRTADSNGTQTQTRDTVINGPGIPPKTRALPPLRPQPPARE